MAAAAEYLDRYDIEAHIARARAAYRHKRDLALATLADVLPPEVRFTRPAGGLFTWLSFPEPFDAAAFMSGVLLPRAKVAYVPGATFFPDRQEPNHARLSFSGLSDERMVDGLGRMGDLLRAEPG
jgi:2-aminoadipate transaminase